jgi:hypothetical protein
MNRFSVQCDIHLPRGTDIDLLITSFEINQEKKQGTANDNLTVSNQVLDMRFSFAFLKLISNQKITIAIP